jgi:hypothetical protein
MVNYVLFVGLLCMLIGLCLIFNCAWFIVGVFSEERVELLVLHVRESRPDLADRFELLLHLWCMLY